MISKIPALVHPPQSSSFVRYSMDKPNRRCTNGWSGFPFDPLDARTAISDDEGQTRILCAIKGQSNIHSHKNRKIDHCIVSSFSSTSDCNILSKTGWIASGGTFDMISLDSLSMSISPNPPREPDRRIVRSSVCAALRVEPAVLHSLSTTVWLGALFDSSSKTGGGASVSINVSWIRSLLRVFRSTARAVWDKRSLSCMSSIDAPPVHTSINNRSRPLTRSIITGSLIHSATASR